MIAFYVIAGALFGFLSPALASCYLGRCITVSGIIAAMLAFVGGVGGHLTHTIITSLLK